MEYMSFNVDVFYKVSEGNLLIKNVYHSPYSFYGFVSRIIDQWGGREVNGSVQDVVSDKGYFSHVGLWMIIMLFIVKIVIYALLIIYF